MIPSKKGGGNNGYLGLVLPAADYVDVDATQFQTPAYPGENPTIAAGAMGTQINEAVRQYHENMREWRECTNHHQATKKIVIEVIDPVYLQAKQDRNVGFSKVSIGDLLQCLIDTYGFITSTELEANKTCMKTPWDPNTPCKVVIVQIQDAMEFAKDGKQTFTDKQRLTTAYNLVFKTGMFFDACKEWMAKAEADKTWDNFQTHFLKAQQLHCEQQTTQTGGYHANTTEKLVETQEALAHLATAAAADPDTLTTLTNMISKLTDTMKQKDNKISALKRKGPGNTDTSNSNNKKQAPKAYDPNWFETD